MPEITPNAISDTLEERVFRAQSGDRKALESVMHDIQKDIHTLAIRFLWHPQDAEDAVQEILIRVMTGLSNFRGESQFRTWVYRVAINALLTLRKQRMEFNTLSFEQFGEDLAQGLSVLDDGLVVEDTSSDLLLVEEIKIGCTLAMLQCLDREHRLAYILGEIMEFDHIQAANVMNITAAAFRKRLSRARAHIFSFMQAYCGLINPECACRCHRRVETAVAKGRVDPSRLLFASSPQQAKRFPQVLVEIRQLEKVRQVAALYQSHVLQEQASGEFSDWLKNLLDEMLDGHTRQEFVANTQPVSD